MHDQYIEHLQPFMLKVVTDMQIQHLTDGRGP
jgi:hypothetical protein